MMGGAIHSPDANQGSYGSCLFQASLSNGCCLGILIQYNSGVLQVPTSTQHMATQNMTKIDQDKLG